MYESFFMPQNWKQVVFKKHQNCSFLDRGGSRFADRGREERMS